MKKLLLASSALFACGQAFAADLPARMPVKASVVSAVPFNWTGCYMGGHVGAGWDRTNFSDPGTVAVPFLGVTPSLQQNIAPLGSTIGVNGGAGALGGIQGGCDYQFANHWVVGLGGDFSWADIHGLGNDPFFGGKNGDPITLTTRTDRIAAVTGRVGYAWDRLLLYGKGGAAWAHNEYRVQNLITLNANFCFNGTFIACNPTGSADRAGWIVGAGFEWAFANNWSAIVEYDHYGFGRKGISFADPNLANQVALLNVKQDIDVIKVGINYRFWSPGPAVSRY